MPRTKVEKRRNPRWSVTLLAKCLITEGGKVYRSDMRVIDVGKGGVRLESVNETFSAFQEVEQPLFHPQKGHKVVIQGLFYDDDGPHGRQGRVCWARHASKDNAWSVGVKFTDHPSKTKSGSVPAFRDFMNVVSHL